DVVARDLALPLHLLQEVDEEEDAVLDGAAALAKRSRGVERLQGLLGPRVGLRRRGRLHGALEADRALEEGAEPGELLLHEIFRPGELEVDALGGEAKDGFGGFGHGGSLAVGGRDGTARPRTVRGAAGRPREGVARPCYLERR